jgi:hypothetical protein
MEQIQAKHHIAILKIKELQSSNTNLQVKHAKNKKAVLKISNKKDTKAKVHWVAPLEKEEAHKLARSALYKEYAMKIKDVFRVADKATNKILIAKELQLLNDHAHSTAMRTEHERHLIELNKKRTDKTLSIVLGTKYRW